MNDLSHDLATEPCCEAIADPQALREAYWLLEEACLRVCDREREPFFAPAVYADVVAGNSVMFQVWRGMEQVGLFICFRRYDSRQGVNKLQVQLAYIRPGQPDAVMQCGLEECRKYAAHLGCERIRFYAVRKGWQRRAKQLGYRLVESVYERRV